MNENQIRAELKCLKSFQGVFACNEHKNPQQLPASYVFNTDPREKSGTHWVAVYIDKNGKGEYFDSFGKKPQKDILNFMRKLCTEIKYNNKCFQQDT